MTIDLDELERLEKATHTTSQMAGIEAHADYSKALYEAAPALIRIARAAKAFWDSTDEDRAKEQDELDEAVKAVEE